nr:integrase, catalytic region, zinc finger, CCHC-type, peptidase aspartic, catalytic [Tanacetum cinerariifolium]GEZ00863.1 integrase, catalytic region, zinc finger, CCHC-type, peptidase aspartic, catalytic [Tanacetum cinerariifolium]
MIVRLKERIKSLSGNLKGEKIKKELEEIETINIELDHRVTKLVTENEHLKQTYKKLYDSIKSSRVRSKEKCDDLIKQVNIKSAENSDLNASLQEKVLVVQIVLWCLDSRCFKHMIEDRSQLTNFVNKFLCTVKFGNDHVAKIMGYGDYKIGNVTISMVYFMEGLRHNLFSVGQFCDSDFEVAFRQHTCFIRNLDGVDLLTGSRGNNLYTLSLGDIMASSPICLLSKASKTKSWLWHRRLSHLNFGAINHLARQGLVRDVIPPKQTESTGSPSSTTVDQDAPSPSKSQTTPENQPPVIPQDVEEGNHDIKVVHMGNDPLFGMPIPEVASDQSSLMVSSHTIVHSDHQTPQHNRKWTKDHPLDNIIEPKTYKDALTQSCWIEAMQEELNEFERLEV